MSVTLILTRHGKAGWEDALEDHERPLTGRGRRSASAIGRWLALQGILPGAALVSSSRRTVETWRALAAELPDRPEPLVTEALYHAGPDRLMAQSRAATHPITILIGHNPGIGGFASRLVAERPDHRRFGDYPTCATVVIAFDGDWPEIGWGQGRVTAFTVPPGDDR